MKNKILLWLFLLINIFSAKGQILYTDFVPDFYLTNQPLGTLDTVALDIDQDAVADFTARCETYFDFVHQGCCWSTDNRIHYNPAEISLAWNNVNAQSICGRMALDSNMWIDSTLYYPTIYTEAYFYRDGNLAQCGWSLDTVQKFYPFRKTVNNDTLYGWIRIEAHPSFMIIYDAAINLRSNVGLYSGQTATGINEINKGDNPEIFPNPFDGKLTVNVTSFNQSEIFIYDITGRNLLHKKFTNSLTLQTEQLDKGVYICEVRNKNGTNTNKKVVKQ